MRVSCFWELGGLGWYFGLRVFYEELVGPTEHNAMFPIPQRRTTKPNITLNMTLSMTLNITLT